MDQRNFSHKCSQTRTIREYSRRSDLYTGKNPDMIKHSASVAMALDKVHEGSDVNALGAVAYPRTYGNRDIVCGKIKRNRLRKIWLQFAIEKACDSRACNGGAVNGCDPLFSSLFMRHYSFLRPEKIQKCFSILSTINRDTICYVTSNVNEMA